MKKPIPNTVRMLLAVGASTALLAACGGSGSDPVAAVRSAYADGLNQLNTTAGLTSKSFQDSFANAYLDSGMDKAALVAALNAEASALAADGSHSLFPMGTLSNISVRDCSSDTCNLVGTLTNDDADTTSVDVTIPVTFVNGALQVVGDQQKT